MTPYFAVLQYDGGGFAGWQKQANDRTVQGELEAGLERLESKRVVTHAAGRTDSGVHALGQVAHVDLLPPRATVHDADMTAIPASSASWRIPLLSVI